MQVEPLKIQARQVLRMKTKSSGLDCYANLYLFYARALHA